MANKPITTTTNTPSPDPVPVDKRYPRPLWISIPRWIFLRWWIIPLICLLVYILDVAYNLYRGTNISAALLLPFLAAHWWQVIVVLIFDKKANEQTRLQFDEYVYRHLQRKALPESIKRTMFASNSANIVRKRGPRCIFCRGERAIMTQSSGELMQAQKKMLAQRL